MNRSSDLRELFHSWIERKEKERSRSVYNPSSNYPPHNPYYSGYNHNNSYKKDEDDSFDGEIFFYEWSNVSNPPKKFLEISEFRTFLRKCNIHLAKYQEDIIRSLRWAYISCKVGSTDLVIRQTWGKLQQDLVNCDVKDKVDDGTTTIRPINKNNVPCVTSSSGVLGMENEEVKEWFG